MILFDDTWLGAVLRIALVVGLAFGGFVYVLVYAERRVSAFLQDRLGPNRVGPFGLLQGLADGIKFFFKEDVMPAGAHKILFLAAPFAAVFPAMMALAVLPLGVRRIQDQWIPLQIANIDVGILFLLSVASLGVFSIILGGWASNSKYPLLGSFRAAAQMISYEIPLGLAVMSVIVLAGSARLVDIVEMQTHAWFIFLTPLGFILFLVSMFAETNRLPFDLPEGETEIIGFHAEYSSMKFAMFFMAEYVNMFTISTLLVLLFLGGWEFLPFVSWNDVGSLWGIDFYRHHVLWVIPTFWLLGKVLFFLFLFIWVRWTLPRFRYDQLMSLGWKRMIPLGLLNLLWVVMVAAGIEVF